MGPKSCSVSIVECTADRKDTIQDLCNVVKAYGGANKQGSEGSMGTLCSRKNRNRRYELQVATTIDPRASQAIVSLEDLFASSQTKPSRQNRYRLALRLSHAVLRFHSTPWISRKWTWSDFSITEPEDSRQDEPHLFVTHQFYSSLNRPPTSKSKVEPKDAFYTIVAGEPILTRLGFALIELAFGKRLAELRTDADDWSWAADSDLKDFQTACRILESGAIREEEGQLYKDVITACVRHEFRSGFTMRCLKSSETSFWKDVEQVILAPLQKLLMDFTPRRS